jgi:hypothetical protein
MRAVFLQVVIVCACCAMDMARALADGPLKPHPRNPRYFSDGTRLPNGELKAVYLTGSHTWNNLIDRGPTDPPAAFDFSAYLNLLQKNNHNFIRLWTRHVSWYHDYGKGELHAQPLPWVRTGPGKALDGKDRFDLRKLNAEYFERLRSRVKEADSRGIYVAVMLFGGNYECTGGWRGNPFHRDNNINGIDGDPENTGHGFSSHTLAIKPIVELQNDYVRKVVDTVNEFDHVLFEISNEGHPSSAEWQNFWIGFIRDYERSKSKQHPIGLTAFYADERENKRLLSDTQADWISPLTSAKGVANIPAADGRKVSFIDSDHWFVKELYGDETFGRSWVWKAFCRGHNTILMEHLRPLSFVDEDYPLSLDDPGYTAARRAMGATRALADKINLGAMFPSQDLASTGFCLAEARKEYVVYQPAAGESFSLKIPQGKYQVVWIDPITGGVIKREQESLNGSATLKPPTARDVVVHLKRHDSD